MSTWLLSVVGVTVIGVLVELLLTDSPMSKFVRSIYAFIILFVIVRPIPGFLKSAQSGVGAGIVLDSALLQTINENSCRAFQRNIENALEIGGFADCIVTLDYDKSADYFKISKVYINAWDSTNKNEESIVKIVTAVCGVSETAVEVFL
jgi:hypothetical protein